MANFLTPLKKGMTAGEKRFTHFLKTYLDDDYLVWHDIPTTAKNRRFPDFLIFHPSHGLWCIEIKDWRLGNLKKANKEQVTIKHGDSEKTHENPLNQARNCLLSVVNSLSQDKGLLQKEGKYQGKLKFPWGYGAVMTYWQTNKIVDKYHDKFFSCFPKNLIFFQDDIVVDKEFPNKLSDKEAFLEKFHGMLPYKFCRGLSKEQADKVRAYIFPDFIINQENFFHSDDGVLTSNVSVMDVRQESIARNMKSGHRVIHGVAGSGKTVILEHRARKLAENLDEEVLVVCFNILLATVIRNRLKESNIKVIHFHGWCSEMIKEYGLKRGKGSIYECVEKPVIDAVEQGIISHKYHAVLIDEGHDFAPEWLRILSKLPDQEDQHLLLLYDDAQSIYDNQKGISFTLSSVGIQARGRTTIMSKNYRNSLEIFLVAEKFIKQFLSASEADDDHIPLIDMESGCNESNSEPTLSICVSEQSEIQNIIEKIREWHKSGVTLDKIAVLFYSKVFAQKINDALIREDISVSYIAEKEDKLRYDPASNSITICPVKSSKGTEFSHVIMSQLASYGMREKAIPEQEARLIYVGLSRAQNALHITSSKKNQYTEALNKAIRKENI